MIDFVSYFDYITTVEYAKGAREHELPFVVIALNAQVYLGQIRICIQNAVSGKV